jgi:hypothetical protein
MCTSTVHVALLTIREQPQIKRLIFIHHNEINDTVQIHIDLPTQHYTYFPNDTIHHLEQNAEMSKSI